MEIVETKNEEEVSEGPVQTGTETVQVENGKQSGKQADYSDSLLLAKGLWLNLSLWRNEEDGRVNNAGGYLDIGKAKIRIYEEKIAYLARLFAQADEQCKLWRVKRS